MNFERLRLRVERREQLLDGRLSQTQTAYAKLRRNWREAWTPGRIVIAGLLAGFVAGHAEPTKAIRRIGAIGGPQWIRTFSALSGLFASVQAIIAAVMAKGAAETADHAAETADVAARTADAAVGNTGETAAGETTQYAAASTTSQAEAAVDSPAEPVAVSPSDRRRRVDPTPATPPRAAEAATDVSER
jgi:hypothetical protein